MEHYEALVSAKAARDQFSRLSDEEMVSSILKSAIGENRAAILDRLANMPFSCKKTYLKAMKGGSRSMAIKAHCLECVGWDRGEVRECTGYACPLYPYRPFV